MRASKSAGVCAVLRTNLFVLLTVFSGASFAQSSDPLAASPVVYDGGAPASDCVNADGTPCLSYVDSQPDDYSVDYSGDGYPAYDPTTYYWPPFYLGVSLWPWGYWGYPYYGYVGWGYGYGWPAWGYPVWGWGWGCCGYWGHYYAWSGDHWHGGHWHDGHDGWHDGHGHDGGHDGHGGHDGGWHDHNSYPGPYRYAGNGQYSGGGSNHMAPGTVRMNDRATAAATFNHSAAEHANGANFARGAGAMPANSRGSAAAFGARGTLPSASYYSSAQRMTGDNVRVPGSLTGARAATNFNGTAVRGASFGPNAQHTLAARGGEQYHVGPMPNRGNVAANRSYAYGSHGYAQPNGYGSHGYAQPNGYGPSRGYSAPNGYYGGHGTLPYHVPSYAGRGGGYAPHGGGMYARGPAGGGGHAPSGGVSHGGGGGGSHGGGGGGGHH